MIPSVRKDSPTYFVNPYTGCWEWQGCLTTAGYASFGRKGIKERYGHRYFYEQVYGPIPKGMTLDHLCRNRRCVNPAHLQPMSLRDNIRRGSAVRLNTEAAKVIRFLGKRGVRYKRLASLYDISQSFVSNIVTGVKWREV